MLFSSLVFLFVFLPIVLVVYYLIPKVAKNYFLFFASIVFFAWGGVSYSSILIFSILFNYTIGLLIDKKESNVWLKIGITVNLLFLIIFKYANFIIDNLNTIIGWFNIPTVGNPNILLPIGISFYTFQAISYLIDVSRKTCVVQKNVASLGLYISLFPQLIAGPIVRYYDIQNQIKCRRYSMANFGEGVQRFIYGFAKKVIIANSMGYVADEIFSLQPDMYSSSVAWLGIVAYSLQIYYDFSGYSDMAIGLAKMFGFDLLENFNYPYISKSIKEFWRRWHISLSNWFRDYLYIPLGGNRKGNRNTIFNLFIVFFVTGFWHGASWNFLIWGLVHGLFLVVERTQFGDMLRRMPSLIQSIYTLLIVVLTWVLFRAKDIDYAMQFYQVLFGIKTGQTNLYLISKILNRETIFILTIALFGALGVFRKLYSWLKSTKVGGISKNAIFINVLKSVALAVFNVLVLLYGTGYLVLGSYNPFIYFRF